MPKTVYYFEGQKDEPPKVVYVVLTIGKMVD